MKGKNNRYAIFAGRVHLMNGGANSFKVAAPTKKEAMELAEEIAQSEKAVFYSWLQILDIVTGTYAEYSIKRGGVLEERRGSSC
ncbi:hypothetical protein MO867_07365 [Microbulbifer sp. OS29]|uniref:Uncharacterized protein n=1 Tax=Microbulbifer okhotskensis TaxID=2926617 RepID=A0A9X2ER59_9GAMM|nr:hypothetical protein [Microbulbifer okhotskensis]MCO1334161.1 hypothetical protein [Microbulbifer okhotskensis]